MPLSTGDKLGPFEILALIGAGGMGEVYRAHDARLRRDVALKVLPATFAHDPERMMRFEREARVLASLSHPNIAPIFGVEESGATRALVMELVEGPTLADRIAAGALPIEEALEISTKIAEALEYAHDRGVVHRDLKPANVKITPEGTVKVLDFGLAKALSDEASTDPQNSPTLTLGATRAGVILGTAAYMAPEQAKGKTADRRADIWAFGVVLFEMLTGRPVFSGETAAEIMASAIKDDPKLERLPASTPGVVRRLIERCLNKDPKQRLQAIGEARIVVSGPMEETRAAAATSLLRSRFSNGVAGVLLIAGAALAFVHFREKPQEERVMRLSISVPENTAVSYLALSPDGRRLAAVLNAESKSQLWLRPLDSSQFQPLSGTLGARNPFWSPDGRFLGFFADGKLKTIPASGGPAQALCDAGIGLGGSWKRDGVILFGTETPGPIMRVNAAGGPCTPVTRVEPNTRHWLPEFLPDGEHFLYVVQATDQAKSGIYLAALDDPAGRRLLADQSGVIYTSPAQRSRVSHLLFRRENTLMAQPFDAAALELAGDPFPVTAQASPSGTNTLPAASAADNGILVYLANRSLDRQLAWFDRSGKELGKVGPRGQDRGVALSPDGKAVLSSFSDGVRLRDLLRGVETRLTQATPVLAGVVWSPDGSRIVFTKNQDLYLKDSSGSGAEELLFQSGNPKYVSDWSRDGRFLLYTEIDPNKQADIWYLPDPLKRDSRQAVKFLATEFAESQAQSSPDGKWVAYFSNESGRGEVYVRPFPPGPGQWRVSASGGREPRWSRDGKELFYLETSGPSVRVMAVAVQLGARSTPEFGAPRKLLEYRGLVSVPQSNAFAYSPMPDGQRFLVNMDADTAEPALNIITNWQKAVAASVTEP